MKKKPQQFDVIVIGAGSGGLNIAGFMNRVGLRVLLIDKEDRTIGGDCLNFGCVPSKALIHVARLIRAGRRAERFGMSGSGEIDMKKVMGYVNDKKEIIRQKENAAYLRNLGMTVVLGKASFAGLRTVEVNGARYRGKKIVIATGSRPRHLDIPGIESVKVYNNENIFSIRSTPKKMVVVGAGPIGVEIGQAMVAFGSEVTIIGSRLLGKEDPEMVAPLKEALERDGVKLLLGYRPVKVEDGGTLVIRNEQGEEQKIPFDMLFESIGRKFNFSELDLEKAGIAVDEKGKLVIDECLRTTNRNVLVCGDAAGGHMFTHAAELHAAVIIKNFFSPWKKKLDTDAMAWVTYSSPEIATFGLSERTLQARRVAYEVVAKDFSESDYAIVNDDTSGKIKLLLSPKGIILGGSIVASNAGELAQELMLAQSNGIKIKAFMNKVYPYPTAARINHSLVLDHMSKKLTGPIKKLLRLLFH
ncbi:MAG: mercuric reductase [Candidatus Moranbacteria bacterium CG_4_9_14_3_um_filter_42_9]|nr:MAG: mercuric reductase [Candidatus Moranbacteria bacterium CG_4_9_14_3_um_filter_42_9]